MLGRDQLTRLGKRTCMAGREGSLPTHYPSTHSALGAEAAEVLKRVFGTDHVSFWMESMTALPANSVRSFNTFTQAADENADSSVMAAIRSATDQGQALRRAAGSYIVAHHLQRR